MTAKCNIILLIHLVQIHNPSLSVFNYILTSLHGTYDGRVLKLYYCTVNTIKDKERGRGERKGGPDGFVT